MSTKNNNIISFQEDNTNALLNKASRALKNGKAGLARKIYSKILATKPENSEARGNLAVILKNQGNVTASLCHYRKILNGKKKEHPDLLSNYGNALAAVNRLKEALKVQQEAYKYKSNDPRILFNLAVSERENGLLAQASKNFSQAKKIGYHLPNSCDFNRSIVELALGNYDIGFKLYEARFHETPSPLFLKEHYPLWQNQPLKDKTIIIHREQGFGDTIQFLRFIPEITQTVEKIILLIKKPMISLIKCQKNFPSNIELMEEKDKMSKPKADYCLPIVSLGSRLSLNKKKITEYSSQYIDIPKKGPKIKSHDSKSLKIGLCWKGSSGHKNDKNRSIALDQLESILSINGCDFYSLQYGNQNDDIYNLGFESIIRIPDWNYDDFAERAFVIDQLDLVISVDTAIVHLAGAVGKKVMMLECALPEWRWLHASKTSPWYESLTRYKQHSLGEWDAPILEIKKHILELQKEKINKNSESLYIKK